MKFCKDCKFFRAGAYCGNQNTMSEPEPVFGHMSMRRANWARSEGGGCEPEAKLFEPAPQRTTLLSIIMAKLKQFLGN